MDQPISVSKTTRRPPSKGWREIAPHLISQRRALFAKCGAKCFLAPDTLKFPICSKEMDCEIQCAGINAAKQRARQYKHEDIAEKADLLWNTYCSPKGKSRSSVKKSVKRPIKGGKSAKRSKSGKSAKRVSKN